MGIIEKLGLKSENNKVSCDDLFEKADAFILETEQALTESEEFLEASFSDEIKSNCEAFKTQIKGLPIIKRFANSKISSLKKVLEELANSVDSRLLIHNDIVATKYVEKARELIGEVEGRTLDNQQMKCIVKPMSNHLVIAGAGTGKTIRMQRNGDYSMLLLRERK